MVEIGVCLAWKQYAILVPLEGSEIIATIIVMCQYGYQVVVALFKDGVRIEIVESKGVLRA